jgi:hypothetical protein
LRSSPGPNQAARRFVLEKFSWERNLSQFVSLVEGRAA